MGEAILNFLATSGLASITWQQAVMLLVSFVLMYLAIGILARVKNELRLQSCNAEADTW